MTFVERKEWTDPYDESPDFAERQAAKRRLDELDASYSFLDQMDRGGIMKPEPTPRREWVLVVAFAIVLFGILALAVTVILWPSRAGAEPFSSTDQAFVKVMTERGLAANSDADTVAAGHDVCSNLTENGGNLDKTIGWLLSISKLESIGDAAYFVGGSAAAYCPQYSPPDANTSAGTNSYVPPVQQHPFASTAAIGGGIGGNS